MAKKQFALIIDSETTVTDRVADFAAVVVDRTGKVYTQCAILVHGFFTDRENHSLFYDTTDSNLWGKMSLPTRYARYDSMLNSGQRMVASVSAINRWLERAALTYSPFLTAYNLPFDASKCLNTGIDLTIFPNQFCLWKAAYTQFGHKKKFLQFVLDNHAFNNPTALGNMTYKTNAEIMARFVLNHPELPDEPHTALEDIIFYELPIFRDLCKRMTFAQMMDAKAYDWKACQVKNFFKVK